MRNVPINLTVSKIYSYAFLMLWAMSIIVTLWVTLPYSANFLLLFLVLAYGCYIVWHSVLLRGKNAIVSMTRQQHTWQLTNQQAQVFAATLRGDSTVTRMLCVLRFDLPEHRLPLTCIIFRDSTDRDTYRRLLITLNHMQI